jgi:hypothetical protein
MDEIITVIIFIYVLLGSLFQIFIIGLFSEANEKISKGYLTALISWFEYFKTECNIWGKFLMFVGLLLVFPISTLYYMFFEICSGLKELIFLGTKNKD